MKPRAIIFGIAFVLSQGLLSFASAQRFRRATAAAP
jgi:hypothetical protein